VSPEAFRKRLQTIRHFALDMDGTIFLGEYVFPFAVDFLRELKRRGFRYVFLTNNSSRNAGEYVRKLTNMGIPLHPGQMSTSAEATITYLKGKGISRIYLVGTQSLHAAFQDAGFETESSRPQSVVVGFDTELTYEKLNRACAWIRRGVPFVATHPDVVCPVENGEFLPDCGAITAAITAATGVQPKVLGKPYVEMLQGLQQRLGARAEEMVLVGDRLTTDIQMGRRFGILTVLVLTGEATREEAARSRVKPDFIVDRISDLLEFLPENETQKAPGL